MELVICVILIIGLGWPLILCLPRYTFSKEIAKMRSAAYQEIGNKLAEFTFKMRLLEMWFRDLPAGVPQLDYHSMSSEYKQAASYPPMGMGGQLIPVKPLTVVEEFREWSEIQRLNILTAIRELEWRRWVAGEELTDTIISAIEDFADAVAQVKMPQANTLPPSASEAIEKFHSSIALTRCLLTTYSFLPLFRKPKTKRPPISQPEHRWFSFSIDNHGIVVKIASFSMRLNWSKE